MKIACIGDNCIDYYDETEQAFPGGNPVNAAVYLRRLGQDASYIGAAGDDAYGRLLLRELRGKGVDVSRVRVCPGHTAVSHVTMRNGDRIFGAYDEGVMASFRPNAEEIAFACAHDLVVTALWGHAEDALAEIRSRGVPTAFDAADRPFDPAAQTALPHASVFFFSDDASTEDALREMLKTLHAGGPEVVVATRGAKGSLAFDGRTYCRQGVVPCEVVDTMGAGDSYIAGFLAAWFSGDALQDCMRAGAENAAVTIGYRGAWETADEEER